MVRRIPRQFTHFALSLLFLWRGVTSTFTLLEWAAATFPYKIFTRFFDKLLLMLFDYQEGFISNVKSVIDRNWYSKRPRINILDMGCETSGRQLRKLSELTRGKVYGINVTDGFPSLDAIREAGPNVIMLNMSGLSLDFPNGVFDLVVSANVLEHVPDPPKFVSEAARVLNPLGVCWLETAPVWTSARGHHVMESMISESCPWESKYRDDGSVIPDWSHLFLDRKGMELTIGDKVSSRTREWILHYLYDSHDLNKAPWSRIEASIVEHFPHSRIHKNRLPGFDERYLPHDHSEDFFVYGFSAICRKQRAGWLKSRLCWRLRGCGL